VRDSEREEGGEGGMYETEFTILGDRPDGRSLPYKAGRSRILAGARIRPSHLVRMVRLGNGHGSPSGYVPSSRLKCS
jgi:hypothetical protein